MFSLGPSVSKTSAGSRIRSVYELSAQHGIKATVYGRSGMGKTTLVGTAPAPLIISAESGLLSLRKVIEDRRVEFNDPTYDLKAWPVSTLDELREVYKWIVSSKEAREYATFALDSVTEIAEEIVNAAKKKSGKNGFEPFNKVLEEILELYRDFRDIAGPNIVFIAKQEYTKNAITGRQSFAPMYPGAKLGQQTPYLFDEVFNIDIYEPQDGSPSFRVLRTQPTAEYEAKDRSGRLDFYEPPNLTYVFNKILGN